jgi:hypothetical protein
MNQDIPLPYGLPAAELKHVPCRLRHSMTGVKPGHHIPVKRGRRRIPSQLDRSRRITNGRLGAWAGIC